MQPAEKYNPTECTYEQPPLPPEGEVSVGPTEHPEQILAARQLVGRVYLARGFVTKEQLDDNGVIAEENDPDLPRARYYVALDHEGSVVATSRIIQHDPQLGRDSFPLIRDHHEELDTEKIDAIENVYGWERVAEISNLARDKQADPKGLTAMQLYRSMIADGWQGESSRVFVMASNPNLDKSFSRLFGGSLKRLGPSLDYPGQPAEPSMLDSMDGLIHMIKESQVKRNPYRALHEEVIRFFLDGARDTQLSPAAIEELQTGKYEDILEHLRTGTTNGKGADEALHSMQWLGLNGVLREKAQHYKPEIIGGSLLLGYTAVRTAAVAVGMSPDTDVDWRAFLAIEVVTTPPYVWAAGNMFRQPVETEGEKRQSRKRKLGVYATFYGALFAPYGYIVAEGGTTTTAGLATTAGMASIPAIAMLRKARQARKQSEQKPVGTPLAIESREEQPL